MEVVNMLNSLYRSIWVGPTSFTIANIRTGLSGSVVACLTAVYKNSRSNSITTASKMPWVLAVRLDCSAKVDSAASRTTTVKSVQGLSMSTVGVNGIALYRGIHSSNQMVWFEGWCAERWVCALIKRNWMKYTYSTQRASADAGDKHLNFHNFLTLNTQIQTFIMLVCPHRSRGNTVDIRMKYPSTERVTFLAGRLRFCHLRIPSYA